MNIPPYRSPPSYLQSTVGAQTAKDFQLIKKIEKLIPETQKTLLDVICPPLPTPRWDPSYLELLSPELQKALTGKKEKATQDKEKVAEPKLKSV